MPLTTFCPFWWEAIHGHLLNSCDDELLYPDQKLTTNAIQQSLWIRDWCGTELKAFEKLKCKTPMLWLASRALLQSSRASMSWELQEHLRWNHADKVSGDHHPGSASASHLKSEAVILYKWWMSGWVGGNFQDHACPYFWRWGLSCQVSSLMVAFQCLVTCSTDELEAYKLSGVSLAAPADECNWVQMY